MEVKIITGKYTKNAGSGDDASLKPGATKISVKWGSCNCRYCHTVAPCFFSEEKLAPVADSGDGAHILYI
jgi:hypothetical protein